MVLFVVGRTNLGCRIDGWSGNDNLSLPVSPIGRKALFGGVGTDDARFMILCRGNNGCNWHVFSHVDSKSALETGSKSGIMHPHESTDNQRDSISKETDLLPLGALGTLSNTASHDMTDSGGGDIGGVREGFIFA